MRTDATPGQTSDHKGFDPVMGDDLPAPCALPTDKGYDVDRIRNRAEARDAIHVIPMRRNHKARAGMDRMLNTSRTVVERCVERLETTLRVAIRCDKTAKSFLGFVDIRSRSRGFVNTA